MVSCRSLAAKDGPYTSNSTDPGQGLTFFTWTNADTGNVGDIATA